MPESRDRLVRPIDVAAAFARRRSGILGVLSDEGNGNPNLFEPPIRQRSPGIALGRGTARGRGGIGRGVLGTPRMASARRRNLYRSSLTGGENTPMTGSVGRGRGRGRPMNSVLPSWYPRTPFRDITPVVRVKYKERTSFRSLNHLRDRVVRAIFLKTIRSFDLSCWRYDSGLRNE